MQFHDDENEKLNRRQDGEPKQFRQPLAGHDAGFAHSKFSPEDYDQYAGLSDAWTELLGIHSLGVQAVPNITAVVPPVASDPWNELLNAQGVQIIDLQQMRSHTIDAPLDDLDLEQALHFMQELPITGANEE
jgi:hypothetical protein